MPAKSPAYSSLSQQLQSSAPSATTTRHGWTATLERLGASGTLRAGIAIRALTIQIIDGVPVMLCWPVDIAAIYTIPISVIPALPSIVRTAINVAIPAGVQVIASMTHKTAVSIGSAIAHAATFLTANVTGFNPIIAATYGRASP